MLDEVYGLPTLSDHYLVAFVVIHLYVSLWPLRKGHVGVQQRACVFCVCVCVCVYYRANILHLLFSGSTFIVLHILIARKGVLCVSKNYII